MCRKLVEARAPKRFTVINPVRGKGGGRELRTGNLSLSRRHTANSPIANHIVCIFNSLRATLWHRKIFHWFCPMTSKSTEGTFPCPLAVTLWNLHLKFRCVCFFFFFIFFLFFYFNVTTKWNSPRLADACHAPELCHFACSLVCEVGGKRRGKRSRSRECKVEAEIASNNNSNCCINSLNSCRNL